MSQYWSSTNSFIFFFTLLSVLIAVTHEYKKDTLDSKVHLKKQLETLQEEIDSLKHQLAIKAPKKFTEVRISPIFYS